MNLIATGRCNFIHRRIHSFVLPILSLTAFGPPVFAEVVTGSSGGNAAIQFWSVSGTGLHREIGAEPFCDSDSCPTTLDIHGWEVRISPTVNGPGDDTRLVDMHDRYERAMDHLAAALLLIGEAQYVGEQVNYHLRGRVGFYIADYGDPQFHSSEYDPWWPCAIPAPDKPSSKGCYRADLETIGITLGMLAKPEDVSHYGVVHELAHAYHDIVVENGFDNRCIARAYELSMAAGKFENIPMFLSERTPGVAQIAGPVYAASNQMEFFAEVTGWFTGNSFGNHYPSSAHQLWEHSPVMYRIAFEQWRGEREFLNEPATTNEKCLAFIAGN